MLCIQAHPERFSCLVHFPTSSLKWLQYCVSGSTWLIEWSVAIATGQISSGSQVTLTAGTITTTTSQPTQPSFHSQPTTLLAGSTLRWSMYKDSYSPHDVNFFLKATAQVVEKSHDPVYVMFYAFSSMKCQQHKFMKRLERELAAEFGCVAIAPINLSDSNSSTPSKWHYPPCAPPHSTNPLVYTRILPSSRQRRDKQPPLLLPTHRAFRTQITRHCR